MFIRDELKLGEPYTVGFVVSTFSSNKYVVYFTLCDCR